jgi:anti-sigma regulatory factor (Ser/Thr protein kinase)
MNEWPLYSFLELAALPTAVPCARLHAKQLAWEWGLEQLASDVELIVSELTTNAVRATVELEQAVRPHHLTDVPCIELRLFSDKEQVLIEVWDGNHQPPEPQGLGADGIPALGEESGRGLFLVEALSQAWGCYATPAVEPPQVAGSLKKRWTAPAFFQSRSLRIVGKVVWAVLA